jgi:hypothetical protein
LVILSNHKLVIAKAKSKANCDSPRGECRPLAELRPPAERRLPTARRPRRPRRPRAVRAPSAGRRRVCYFPKAELAIFSKAELVISRYLMPR